MDTVKMGTSAWRLVFYVTSAMRIDPNTKYNTIGQVEATAQAASGGGVMFTDRSSESIEHEQFGYLIKQYPANAGWRNHTVHVKDMPYTPSDMRRMAEYMENK